MFEVTKNSSHVIVRAVLKKRSAARDPKVYLYVEDALAAAKEKFPHVKFADQADNAAVASNVKGPYEVEWKFAIEKKKEQPAEKKEQPAEKKEQPAEKKEQPAEKKEQRQQPVEKKYLKDNSRRAKLEKLNKQIQAEFSKED